MYIALLPCCCCCWWWELEPGLENSLLRRPIKEEGLLYEGCGCRGGGGGGATVAAAAIAVSPAVEPESLPSLCSWRICSSSSRTSAVGLVARGGELDVSRFSRLDTFEPTLDTTQELPTAFRRIDGSAFSMESSLVKLRLTWQHVSRLLCSAARVGCCVPVPLPVAMSPIEQHILQTSPELRWSWCRCWCACCASCARSQVAAPSLPLAGCSLGPGSEANDSVEAATGAPAPCGASTVEEVLLLRNDIVRSGLAAREYGGGTSVFASFALQMKLELSESTVLVPEMEPTGCTM
uniref:Uncharacterized protein n=1 Tax=Anopheles farauti TaxID=69004 RepID=A0A182Q380_9DIPT